MRMEWALVGLLAAAAGGEDGGMWAGDRAQAAAPEEGVGADTLTAELVLRTGGAGGDLLLEQVEAVEVDEAGRVYLLDGYAHTLHALSRDGDVLWSVGREGQGPGELDAPVGLAWDPDGRLWIVDPGNQRITPVGPDGDLGEGRRVPSGFVLSPWPGRFDRSGRFHHYLDAADGSYDFRMAAYDGELERVSVADPPGAPRPEEYFEGRTPRGSHMRARVPFTPRLVWRLDGDGRFVWVWTDEMVVHGPGERTRGDPGRRPRGPRVSPAERRAALEGLDRFEERGGRVDPGRIPERKPVLQTFVLDERDRVWALLSAEAEDPGTIVEVFDASGHRGTVSVDAWLAGHPTPVVRRGWIVGVESDELGRQTVILARVPELLR